MTRRNDTIDADGSTDGVAFTRRDVLKTTATGAVAAGIGSQVLGTAAGQGIPTPKLSVDGNLITDPTGQRVKLRGVNMADPKRVNVTAPARGKTATQVVDLLTDNDRGWHPKVVRIPVQPVDIGEHTPGSIDGAPEPPAFDRSQLEEYVETHLDPVVERCKERNVYCIVDFHRHWKPVQWADQDENLNEPLQDEVMTFWEYVAPHYAGEDHVIFEVYNEPTKPGLYGSKIEKQWIQDRWMAWKRMAQPWVDEIRAHADNHVIVGSPGWSQHVQGVLIEEFDGPNLSYTYHIYPGHVVSMNKNWAAGEESINQGGTWGVYEEVPMFVTEFGWNSDIISRWLRGTTSEFGEPFVEFLESSPGIHWTAWCADPVWLPRMFDLGDWTGGQSFQDNVGNPYEESVPELCSDLPCEWTITTGENMGQFIKDALARHRDDGNPSGQVPTEDSETPTATDSDTATATTESTPRGTPGRVGDNANLPSDPDSDGLYEDVNGNGRQDIADAVDLFQHQDSVDAGFFDFNGSGEVEIGDAVELFRENT